MPIIFTPSFFNLSASFSRIYTSWPGAGQIPLKNVIFCLVYMVVVVEDVVVEDVVKVVCIIELDSDIVETNSVVFCSCRHPLMINVKKRTKTTISYMLDFAMLLS